MLIGSKIPAGVHSIYIYPVGGKGTSSQGCVSNVQPGKDKNTGLTITTSSASYANIDLYSDSKCSGASSFLYNIPTRYLPSGLTTTNWWISLE